MNAGEELCNRKEIGIIGEAEVERSKLINLLLCCPAEILRVHKEYKSCTREHSLKVAVFTVINAVESESVVEEVLLTEIRSRITSPVEKTGAPHCENEGLRFFLNPEALPRAVKDLLVVINLDLS